MTDDEIKAAYKAIEAKEKEKEQLASERHRRNERTFNLIALAKEVEYIEPVVFEDQVGEYDGEYGNGQRHYVDGFDDYVETLPVGAWVKITVEVLGPKITEPLFYECEFANHGLKFEVGTGKVKIIPETIFNRRAYFCPEHQDK